MQQTPYIQDILAQPGALRIALQNFPGEKLAEVRTKILNKELSKIILTGMGSSYNSAYAAFLELQSLPIPSVLINSAELLHYGFSAIDENTLLWMNSQSGRSVEVVRIIEKLKNARPKFQLSMTNYMDSPLATSADLALDIHAGAEATVSTKTYINTTAYLLLAAYLITGKNWLELKNQMLLAADAIEEYLNQWQERISRLDHLLGEVDKLVILGRGTSMGAVWNGSLINKEAAKCTFEGMNSADFRHGPLELVAEDFTALVFEGAEKTAKLNYDIAKEVKKLNGKVLWISPRVNDVLPTIQLPSVHDSVLPLVEILPLQLLSVLMANRKGYVPGQFRYIGKVTEKE